MSLPSDVPSEGVVNNEVPDLSNNTSLRSLDLAGLGCFELLPRIRLNTLNSLRFRFRIWNAEVFGILPWDLLRDFLRRNQGGSLQTTFHLPSVFTWDRFGDIWGTSTERFRTEAVDRILKECRCRQQDGTVFVQFEAWNTAYVH